MKTISIHYGFHTIGSLSHLFSRANRIIERGKHVWASFWSVKEFYYEQERHAFEYERSIRNTHAHNNRW